MLVWIDCEMTGLDTFNDTIIEICVLLTDDQLNVIDEKGFERVIHVPESRLEQMNQWCLDHHRASGLWDQVLRSNYTHNQVQQELLEYLAKYVPAGKGVLAGNTVHMDRAFMMREFPKVIDYLFYRIIDVSSIKEVCKRHNPQLLATQPEKKKAHTARLDILESIAELRWYQEHYFKGQETQQEANRKRINK